MVPFAGYDMPLGYDGVSYGMFGLLNFASQTRNPANAQKTRIDRGRRSAVLVYTHRLWLCATHVMSLCLFVGELLP